MPTTTTAARLADRLAAICAAADCPPTPIQFRRPENGDRAGFTAIRPDGVTLEVDIWEEGHHIADGTTARLATYCPNPQPDPDPACSGSHEPLWDRAGLDATRWFCCGYAGVTWELPDLADRLADLVGIWTNPAQLRPNDTTPAIEATGWSVW